VQKQAWVFLTEADEAELLSRVASRFPVRLLRGRFFQGTLDDLRRAPQSLPGRAVRSGEHIVQIWHPDISQALVADPMTEGPMAGWMRLDEVRSEVVTLVRPDRQLQGLPPSRLMASTHAWFGGQRLRKSPAFGQWAAELLDMVKALPTTAYDWMHVAEGARQEALAGQRLQYLYQEVALEPDPGATPMTRPHQGK